MANNQLITGAGVAAKKFVDAAAEINKGFSAATQSARGFNRPNTVTKNQEYQNRVNSLMGKMKTDMDFTSFSPAETASMRTFLVNERQKYADAAKAVANMTDATSPEYMAQVDIMNGVNNSFTNLAGQLKSYKKGKAEYAEGMMSGTYSDGNELENSKVNSTMYGFIDEDGDGKSDSRLNAPFSIMQGGNIGFNIEGETVTYNDTTPPLLKDYELGVGLLKQNEEVRKSGRLVGADAEKMYRLQLQTAFANQDSLRSFIYDFEDEFPTEDLGKLWEENPNNGDVINQIRGQVIDRLVNSRVEAGKTGYSQRQSRGGGKFKNYSKAGTTMLLSGNPNADEGAGEYQIWTNIDKTMPQIYRLIKKVAGLEDNNLPPQNGDGTETNDSGLADDLRNERAMDPTKDKDEKAGIMKKVKKKNPNFSKEQVIAETNRILKGI
jgi:hypothetical protein